MSDVISTRRFCGVLFLFFFLSRRFSYVKTFGLIISLRQFQEFRDGFAYVTRAVQAGAFQKLDRNIILNLTVLFCLLGLLIIIAIVA